MKSYFKRNRFFLLCILFFATALSPIAAMDGAGMAFKVSLSGKIYRRFSFLVEEDIRPQSDFRQAEWFLTTGEVNYTFNRYFKTGIAYMLLCRYKASEELRNRYYVYASANYPVGNFTLSLRERFQSTYKQAASIPRTISAACSPSPTRSGRQAFALSPMPRYSTIRGTRGGCMPTGYACPPEATTR